MEQFSLEEYIKNPDRKIITRDGRNAKIICTDGSNPKYPIIALIQSERGKDALTYTIRGRNIDGSKCLLDLFFVSNKKEGWINLYKDGNKTEIGNVYPLESEELAKEAMSDKNYIATCKIEWEE